MHETEFTVRLRVVPVDRDEAPAEEDSIREALTTYLDELEIEVTNEDDDDTSLYELVSYSFIE